MTKAARRARKKANKAKRGPKYPAPKCDYCGAEAPSNKGDHDTNWSKGHVTADGLVVVAWCPACGSDSCS